MTVAFCALSNGLCFALHILFIQICPNPRCAVYGFVCMGLESRPVHPDLSLLCRSGLSTLDLPPPPLSPVPQVDVHVFLALVVIRSFMCIVQLLSNASLFSCCQVSIFVVSLYRTTTSRRFPFYCFYNSLHFFKSWMVSSHKFLPPLGQ